MLMIDWSIGGGETLDPTDNLPAENSSHRESFFMENREIVFVTKYYCEICGKERVIRVFGDKFSRSYRDEEYEREVIKWAKHYHWVDSHRVCAVCGKIVKAGELGIMVNNGNIKIHDEYTDEYKKNKQGDNLGHLLIVHEKCLEKMKLEVKIK